MCHVKQFAFIIKKDQRSENFWKKAFKISSFVLILVLMFPISIFIKDAQ